MQNTLTNSKICKTYALKIKVRTRSFQWTFPFQQIKLQKKIINKIYNICK